MPQLSSPQMVNENLIYDENDRIVVGWATVEEKDKDGELIKIEDVYKAFLKAQERGLPVVDSHSNRIVGKILNFFIDTHKETGKNGIKVIYKIFNDYPYEDKIWNEIKTGKRKGLSIGGITYANKIEYQKTEDGELVKVPKDIALFEVSTVENPANPYALNEEVNMLAKSSDKPQEKLEEKIKKTEEVPLLKPFAGYKNFDECVKDQKSKGKSEESAKKICGWLQSRFEKDDIEKYISDNNVNKGDIMEQKEEKIVKEEVSQSSSLEEKIDKILSILEKILSEKETPKKEVEEKKPEEKPEEKPDKKIEKKKEEVKPIEKKEEIVEVIKSERPAISSSENEEEDIAYKIAKGERFDIRAYEDSKREMFDKKLKEFFKKR